MAELKTQRSADSVAAFLSGIEDAARQADARALVRLLGRVTGEKPAMWGAAIIGFGQRTIVYPNGRTLDWMRVGFSPRKANSVLYLPGGHAPHGPLLAKLGKHKTGKGCLYLKSLADVDLKVLEELVRAAVALAG
jgi:hypothetical protein